MNRRRVLRHLGLSAFCLTGSLASTNGSVAALIDAISAEEAHAGQPREKSLYHLAEFRGTARDCGRGYGSSQAEAIGVFLNQELQPDTLRSAYAERCGKILQETNHANTNFLRVFSAGYFGRTMFVGSFWMCQVIPLFAIYTFGPQILSAFHLGGGNRWILGYALINVSFLLGCIPDLALLNSVGRRPLIILSFFFMTLGLLVLALFPEAPTWVIISGFLLYAFFSGGPSVLEGFTRMDCFLQRSGRRPLGLQLASVGLELPSERFHCLISCKPLGLARP